MIRLLVAVVVASLLSGCPGPSPVDAGTGGGSGGGTTGGGGGTTGGGGGTTGGGGGTTGGGGGSSGLDGGTLAGALSFPVLQFGASGSVMDGGADVSLVTMTFLDHALAGPVCNPTFSLPLTYVQLTVQMFDGGALTPGTYAFPLDVYGKREALATGSQESQYLTQGTITLTQVGSARTAGTLNATLDHGDGGTSTLTGSWNGPICPL